MFKNLNFFINRRGGNNTRCFSPSVQVSIGGQGYPVRVLLRSGKYSVELVEMRTS